ncbi:MAG: ATP-binding cassette domain-containing protein [Trueperaceae bacterium]|nr:ATP-binding cassette domain-containing protein [Trueperaceae bacterium]
MRGRHDRATMLIETRGLTLRRGDRVLLRDFDWAVHAGERWALIGPNGVGKSTLLWALAGGSPSAAREGAVRRAPGAWVASVAQHEGDAAVPAGASLRDLAWAACAPLRELGAELERRAAALGGAPSAAELEAYGAWEALFHDRGGYDVETRLDEALHRIGLADAAYRDATAASGGERRRARLAGALVAGADVLLLDEPTNHLDLATRGWLAERLVRFEGAVVFASHDRAWIDAVATHVLQLGGGAPRRHAGGYARARRAEDERQRADAKAERLRRKRIAELEAMAAELRAQGHRRAEVRRRRATRELAGLRATPPAGRREQAPGVELAAGTEGGELARFTHLTVGEVLHEAAFSLRGGERWALVGPSGSGKTTLLRLLAGEIDSDDPRAQRWWRPGTAVWFVDQHDRGLSDETTPLDAVAAWVGATRAASLLGQVRLAREAWSRPAATLSGGERARAGLALLMAREADVLLLDEPTNDLDLPMIEALEEALRATRAAVVVATHDARLLEALGAEVVTIEDGACVRWRGGLAGWRRGARRLEPGEADLGDRPEEPEDADGVPSDGPEEETEDGDRERAFAEEVLADPLRWGERERARWRSRRRAAEEDLLAAWDRRAAPALPPYRTREAGWRVWGEPVDAGLRVWLDGDDGLGQVTVRIVATAAGRIGHVVTLRADDRSLTRSARRALLRGAARLAFYVQGVDAVQVAGEDPGGFEPLAPGWWVWRRRAFERQEGWRRPVPRRRAPGRPARRRAGR